MFTVQGDSMDADSESVQGIKTMNRQEQEDQAQLEYLRKWKEKKQKRKNDRRQTIKLCEKKARKNGCPECCEQCDLNTRGGYRYDARNLIKAQGQQLWHGDVTGYIARKYKIGSDTVGDNDKGKTGSIQK